MTVTLRIFCACVAVAALVPSIVAPALAHERSSRTAVAETTLWDQYDHPATARPVDITSQDFERHFDDRDSFAADDFVIPAGQSWTISGIDVEGSFDSGGHAASMNVFFYANNADNLPGAFVTGRSANAFTQTPDPGSFVVTLSSSILLDAGTYWVSVQAREDQADGQWFWHYRTVQSGNGAAWQNPGNWFVSGCTSWARVTSCATGATSPDLVFRIKGSSVVNGACRFIASGLAIGLPANHFDYLADDAVAYTYANSRSAPHGFAIFQTHDPWGATVVKDAISRAGHDYATFTPDQLAGFTFADYRVVVLNWDQHTLAEFKSQYKTAQVSMQDYVRKGGVLWVQAAILGEAYQSFNIPFGGTGTWSPSTSDYVAARTSPLVAGAPSYLSGNPVSTITFSGQPAWAKVVVSRFEPGGPPKLYELCGPSVTHLSAQLGTTAGGRTVTITGQNFTGATAVRFGTVPAASFTVNSPTRITAVTPAHDAGLFQVSVVTPLGTMPAARTSRYTFRDPPAISSVSPALGPPGGGQTVTITGTDFTDATAVKFGTVPAASFVVNSGTRITAVTPAHDEGVFHVRVTTPIGTTAMVAGDRFRFEGAPSIGSLAPNSGSTLGGQTVTITGTNLIGATTVQFGLISASSFTVVSETRITAVAPAHDAGTIDVRVTTPMGQSPRVAGDHYTFN